MFMKLIECPRDAMQGIHTFIPTAKKAAYINQLLRVGFDTIDFGSFVSPKAIPQMSDTAAVLDQLNLKDTTTKLLAIVANMKGAEQAVSYNAINYLGFPLSISETFQQRNTNKSIAEALNEVARIQALCMKNNKALVCYISMGFGNPYGDPYDAGIVGQMVEKLKKMGIRIVSLADTVGVSTPELIVQLFKGMKTQFPDIEFGAHLHSHPAKAVEKMEAAFQAGCDRFDGALNGLGGCPMANDDLVGNLATETILAYLEEKGAAPVLNKTELAKALAMVAGVFPK